MKQHCFLSRRLTATLSFLFFTQVLFAQQYHIYMYDVKKGSSEKITNGLQGDMYNAAWSNHGKRLAYDLVGAPALPFNQSIFITDLQTGMHQPLAGAEGGNDPAWSPNGETIAFDESYTYPQSIYTVPSGGGARTILRYNAHHASWNPTGNKIAFDDNYGYIATKDIYTGAETFVTFYGSRPFVVTKRRIHCF